MNFGTPVPLLMGIVLILGAIALFFLDKLKPGYGRDADKVYAILWLVCGVILLAHLTMGLLEAFQQLLMVGMLIALTIENITSRGPKGDRYASQGASDGPTPREPYRPRRPDSYSRSSRMNVRAELENDRPPRDPYYDDRRALRGREEPGVRRFASYQDDYPERYGEDKYGDDRYGDDRYGDDRGYGSRPNQPSERPVGRLAPSGDRIRRRRPKPGENRYGDVGTASGDWSDSAPYGPNTGGYSSHSSSPPGPRQRNGADSDSYVDYRPVDSSDEDPNRPSREYGSRY